MTSHPQQVHTTRHLHPFFVVGVVGFFFVLIFVLFGNPWNKRTVQQDVRVTMQVPPQKNIIEPRFDRKPQEKVGPYRYTSEFMKISFDVPEGYVAQEKINEINLIKGGDSVNIAKISTNYDNISSYFASLKSKNHLKTIFEKSCNAIENCLFVKFQSSLGGEVSYFLFNNYEVYSLSQPEGMLVDVVTPILNSLSLK